MGTQATPTADDQLDLQPNANAAAFNCPECGGKMNFDAAAGQLGCGYCGHTVAVGKGEAEQNIVEYDLEHGLAMSSQRGYGTPVRTTKCEGCGATVSFGESVTSTACDFCGSSKVLPIEEQRNVLRPESVVPFLIEHKKANELFAGWIKGLWFRPNDLKHLADISAMNGVYVPYWTFDSDVASSWTALAGYYYYVTVSFKDASGNTQTRQERRTRWVPAWGNRADNFDDLLVCASKGLPQALAERLKTFDTAGLKPYDPAFLAGWKAEEYSVDLNAGWKTAVAKMESTQRARCAGDVPGDTHSSLSVTNRFSNETFKHVLLPIWISAYRYKDKTFQFLVNGQTGEVTGKAPVSWFKIILFIAVLIGIGVGIYALVQK